MDLLLEAQKAMKNSYSPYSNFKVGAAILTKDNLVYSGTNIENVSFGLTICAERVALFKAISDGVRKEDMSQIAIVSDTENPIVPCGACLQVMMELMGEDTIVTLGNMKGKTASYLLKEMLPHSFKELL